ncbi:hypothetical protein D3C87_1682590 [compost metagenome]
MLHKPIPDFILDIHLVAGEFDNGLKKIGLELLLGPGPPRQSDYREPLGELALFIKAEERWEQLPLRQVSRGSEDKKYRTVVFKRIKARIAHGHGLLPSCIQTFP